MRRVSRSALVPYSVSDMYALAADVESYPTFLPWCSGAEIHSRAGEIVEATLELHKSGIRNKFRTRNRLRENKAIEINLVGGPFRHLSGGWRFDQLGDAGSKIALDLDFEFKSRANDLLFGSIIEKSCNSLVDAFTRRAQDIYGANQDIDQS
jgi:ribosome-associated toxin RatA of RatAB toxin-antitoxin module